MLVRPTPGALVWPAAMIVWGSGFTAAGHSHHCVQLVMAMRGNLLIRGESEEKWTKCGAAVVQPDVRHEVDARDTTVLVGFVDSESELGAALGQRNEGDICCIPKTRVSHWRTVLGTSPTEAEVERWVRKELLHGRRAVRIHPKVKRVLQYLRERPGFSNDFSLKTLADMSGLSQSRLMHVFTESVGVPLRPYILWLRLQRASCDLMGGASVTAAAHSAGFSDAAHLTRTFRRMLGMTPTDLGLRKRLSQGVSLESSSLSRTDQSDAHR